MSNKNIIGLNITPINVNNDIISFNYDLSITCNNNIGNNINIANFFNYTETLDKLDVFTNELLTSNNINKKIFYINNKLNFEYKNNNLN